MTCSNKDSIIPIQQHGLNSTPFDPNPKITTNFLHHRHFFNNQWDVNTCHQDDDDTDDDDDVNNMDSIVNLAKAIHDDDCDKIKPVSGFENNNTSSRGDGRNGNYTQYLNGVEGTSRLSSGNKDIVVVDDGCGFSGRKEVGFFSEQGESLTAILSDPITGTLMDDAMILPCGHSFGSGGIQQVVRMKACYTCSGPVSDDSIAPNLTLRVAVQAFRREDELHVNRTSKRRKENYYQDKGTCGDSTLTDHQRGRGVQFPFVVTDRVIIKGNKRTPPHFVGREAIVTTQCLNGWYVVKTVDNAESVKLQYRSLSKVTETNSSSKPSPIKTIANWL